MRDSSQKHLVLALTKLLLKKLAGAMSDRSAPILYQGVVIVYYNSMIEQDINRFAASELCDMLNKIPVCKKNQAY